MTDKLYKAKLNALLISLENEYLNRDEYLNNIYELTSEYVNDRLIQILQKPVFIECSVESAGYKELVCYNRPVRLDSIESYWYSEYKHYYGAVTPEIKIKTTTGIVTWSYDFDECSNGRELRKKDFERIKSLLAFV